MYCYSLALTIMTLGASTFLLASNAMAKPTDELKSITKAVTVEIRLQQDKSVGSGVIIDRKKDLYTLITNRHVVCGSSDQRCNQLPSGEVYSLGLPDGTKHLVKGKAITLLGNGLDLAVVRFRSKYNHTVAKIVTSEKLKVTDAVYTAGFPASSTGFRFGEGEAVALVYKRLTGDQGGYTMIYNAGTLPGMSGGGVFNSAGQLVAIHGYGDRYKENTEIGNNPYLDTKIGFNRGIPVRWLVQELSKVGVSIQSQTPTNKRTKYLVQNPADLSNADEHFVIGLNQFINPENDILAGKRQAIQSLNMAIEQNPKYSKAYFLRGYIYEQIQDFPQALTNYNQAINLNPKYAEAYNNRGMIKYQLQDLIGAFLDLDTAIMLNPNIASLYNNRGILQSIKGDQIAALTDYDRAIAIDMNYAKVYINRGNIKIRRNDLIGALADYDQSISLNLNDAIAYHNRGIAKYEQKNLPAAIADFDQAISLNMQSHETYILRGRIKEEQNDLVGALDDYNQIIKLDPKDAEAYMGRGLVRIKQGDWTGALADYNQVVELNPNNEKAYISRGLVKYRQQDLVGAVADLNKAITLNPGLASAYISRALIKEQQGDLTGALKDYDQVITLNPQSANTYLDRGKLKKQLADRNGAIADFRRSAQLYREQGQNQKLSDAIDQLRQVGVVEQPQ
jgi:tetratricopeptide (TPR) repeat protein